MNPYKSTNSPEHAIKAEQLSIASRLPRVQIAANNARSAVRYMLPEDFAAPVVQAFQAAVEAQPAPVEAQSDVLAVDARSDQRKSADQAVQDAFAEVGYQSLDGSF